MEVSIYSSFIEYALLDIYFHSSNTASRMIISNANNKAIGRYLDTHVGIQCIVVVVVRSPHQSP